jgi:hypothetical protein
MIEYLFIHESREQKYIILQLIRLDIFKFGPKKRLFGSLKHQKAMIPNRRFRNTVKIYSTEIAPTQFRSSIHVLEFQKDYPFYFT